MCTIIISIQLISSAYTNDACMQWSTPLYAVYIHYVNVLSVAILCSLSATTLLLPLILPYHLSPNVM